MKGDRTATKGQLRNIERLGIRVPPQLTLLTYDAAERLIADAEGRAAAVRKQMRRAEQLPMATSLKGFLLLAALALLAGVFFVYRQGHRVTNQAAEAVQEASRKSVSPKRSARLEAISTSHRRKSDYQTTAGRVEWAAQVTTFGEESFPVHIHWYVLGKTKSGDRALLQSGTEPTNAIPLRQGGGPQHTFTSTPVSLAGARSSYKLDGWVMLLKTPEGEELAGAHSSPESLQWLRTQAASKLKVSSR